MTVALTRSMSVLKIARRNAALLLAATVALVNVACSGEDAGPAYASTDIDVSPEVAGQPDVCEAGAVQSCTIWLGQHGDLANCIHGVKVCTGGAWSDCIDEETVADNPELYAELTEE